MTRRYRRTRVQRMTSLACIYVQDSVLCETTPMRRSRRRGGTAPVCCVVLRNLAAADDEQNEVACRQPASLPPSYPPTAPDVPAARCPLVSASSPCDVYVIVSSFVRTSFSSGKTRQGPHAETGLACLDQGLGCLFSSNFHIACSTRWTNSQKTHGVPLFRVVFGFFWFVCSSWGPVRARFAEHATILHGAAAHGSLFS